MYVCNCNAVTDHAIHDAVAAGVSDFTQLQLELGVACCCGRCEPHARAVLQEALSANATVRLPRRTPVSAHANERLPTPPTGVRLPLPA